MEYIYVCPKCSAVFGCADKSGKTCSCGADTVFTGYTDNQWYALSREAREKIKYPTSSAATENRSMDQAASSQSSPSPSFGSNPLKKLGIALIVVGIICGILGTIASTSLANSYKGHNVITGYVYDGEYHETDSFVMGGNSDAVRHYNGLKVFFIAASIAIVATGIFLWVRGDDEDRAPVLKKRGMVIDTPNYYTVTIEFNDGVRKSYGYNQNKLILLAGDFGDFEIKGQTVISFTKN